MELADMKVLLVSLEDYTGVIRSVWGLSGENREIYDADLIIDTDTGKILKSRHF